MEVRTTTLKDDAMDTNSKSYIYQPGARLRSFIDWVLGLCDKANHTSKVITYLYFSCSQMTSQLGII